MVRIFSGKLTKFLPSAVARLVYISFLNWNLKSLLKSITIFPNEGILKRICQGEQSLLFRAID